MSQGQSSTWKWVAIGCAVLLLAGLCTVGTCAACAAGILSATAAPANEAKEFLADLRGGRVEQAYSRMSEQYRAGNNVEAFRSAIGVHPALLNNSDDTINNRNTHALGANMGGYLTTPEGNVAVNLTLVQQDSRWYISSVQVGDGAL